MSGPHAETVVRRPAADVVVPFFGSESELHSLRIRLHELRLRPGDTLVVVDNRPAAAAATPEPGIVRAPECQSSYHARNRGAAHGHAPWLVFLDADVLPAPDLLDRYFAEPIDERVAVLAGAIEDVPPAGRAGLAARYAGLARSRGDENVWRPGFAYAQTGSAAVRRLAFEAIGGFEEVRSGGDADLCFRLAHAGWRVERRPEAVARHRGRASVRALLRHRLRHGAGAAWLEARYPGFSPALRRRWFVTSFPRWELAAAWALARGDEDRAVRQALDPLCTAAFELGRRLPNRPGSGRAVLASELSAILQRSRGALRAR